MQDPTDDTNAIFEDDGHLNKSDPDSYVEGGSYFAHDGTNV